MNRITLNMAINMLLLVQLLPVSLAFDEISPPSVKPPTIDVEETKDIQALSDQYRPIAAKNDSSNLRVQSVANFVREHSATRSNIKLTGPLDLKVNTTTPNSITLQWRLNPEMKGKIIYYRVYYVHDNYPDVKTIKLPNQGTYELTGLGE